MEINCEFKTVTLCSAISSLYTCCVTSAVITIPDVRIKSLLGKHTKGKNNFAVKVVWFNEAVVNFIPRGLTEIFPNLIHLRIENCDLKKICREDLVGFENLESLMIRFNELTALPDDLFVNTPKLRCISFIGNKIESMSSNLFKPIINNEFKCIDFERNSKINAFYQSGQSGSVTSVAELMRIIDAQCSKPKTIEPSQVIQAQDVNQKEKLISSLEYLFVTGNFSDFLIIASKQQKFKVHKCILAAQSEGFAEMFQSNPTAKELKIDELSLGTVKEFLRYFYTAKLPKNLMEIFALASKFKVPELKSKLGKQFLSSLNEKNAWKIFSLAHKFDSEEMKIAAFKEIQKMFPDKNLPEKMAGNLPMVQKLIELKSKIDEVLAEVIKTEDLNQK